jgi:hypothetical protein
MFLSSFDILRKNHRGKPILLAVEGDLETACLGLSRLASLTPGEYFVFDSRTHQIVAAMDDPVASHMSVNRICLASPPLPIKSMKLLRYRCRPGVRDAEAGWKSARPFLSSKPRFRNRGGAH